MHTWICAIFSLPPGVGGWLRFLLVALPGLFCLPFYWYLIIWKALSLKYFPNFPPVKTAPSHAGCKYFVLGSKVDTENVSRRYICVCIATGLDFNIQTQMNQWKIVWLPVWIKCDQSSEVLLYLVRVQVIISLGILKGILHSVSCSFGLVRSNKIIRAIPRKSWISTAVGQVHPITTLLYSNCQDPQNCPIEN